MNSPACLPVRHEKPGISIKRIFGLLVSVLFVVVCAGLVWSNFKLHRQYQASAWLEEVPREPWGQSIHNHDGDLIGHRALLVSRMLTVNILASCSKEDWEQLLATTETPLGRSEVRTEADRVAITVYHQNPAAAVLLANRRATEFIKFLFDQEGSINDQALTFLKTRAAQMEHGLNAAVQRRDKIDRADAVKWKEAEKDVETARTDVWQIKDRIQQLGVPLVPSQLPIRIASLAQKAEPLPWWKSL